MTHSVGETQALLKQAHAVIAKLADHLHKRKEHDERKMLKKAEEPVKKSKNSAVVSQEMLMELKREMEHIKEYETEARPMLGDYFRSYKKHAKRVDEMNKLQRSMALHTSPTMLVEESEDNPSVAAMRSFTVNQEKIMHVSLAQTWFDYWVARGGREQSAELPCGGLRLGAAQEELQC